MTGPVPPVRAAEQVEVDGRRILLRAARGQGLVEVRDAQAADVTWLATACFFEQSDAEGNPFPPVVTPRWGAREWLGTTASDPHGKAVRALIGTAAERFHHRINRAPANAEPGSV